MALIKCRECASEVSSKAETCPKCGARVAAKPIGCGSLLGIIFISGIIISIFSAGSINDSTLSSASPSSASVTETVPSIELSSPGSQWSYPQVADPMSNGTTNHAVVISSNTVEFDFPYAGKQHAKLNLRTDSRYGRDVIFSIEKGQILCHSYEDCTVLVRFDDGKAINYSAVGAADSSTETIFLRNYSGFVEKMLKSKTVRISTNIYHEGAPIFEFDVSGFDVNKYKPRK